MRSSEVAEWILSLVTSPERAAATVGDLLENASELGTFWLGVLRTAVSLLWQEVAAHPARMTGLAFRGFLVGLGLLFVCFLIIIPLTLVLSRGGVQDETIYASWPFTAASILALILVPFQQGRWLARRSPGQELAACLALAILTATVDAIPVALGMETISQLVLSIAAPLIPLFAGAVLVRKKQTAR
jgi:hypothetical protein